MLRVRSSLIVAALPLWLASSALGQSTETSERPAAAVGGPIWVKVDASLYQVDESAIRVAIAKELGVAISSGESGAKTRASVLIGSDGNMVVSYEDESGRRLLRAIEAPKNPAEVPEAAALLLGNLARDQSSALLEELAPTPVPSPEPAEPEPAEPEAPPPEEKRPATPPVEETLPELGSAPLNLALVHPINTVPSSEEHRIAVDLSLFYSRVGAIDAFAVSGGVVQVERDSNGLTAVGIGNVTHGDGYGLSAAGLFSVRGGFAGLCVDGIFTKQHGRSVGLQASGVVSVREGQLEGASVAGAVGVSEGDATGMLASGVVNVHLGELEGAQFAGALNVQEGAVAGAQVAGALNVQHGAVSGAEVAAAANVASGDVAGAQFAAANVAGDVTGVQIGIVNVGARVRGLQLGVINWAQEVDGASVGVVTYSGKGRTQLVGWFDSERPLNVGVRFYTGPLYAMPSIGLRRRGGADEYAPGFSLGARLPLGRLFADLDVNYSTRAPDFQFDEHNIDLRYRGLVGYEVIDGVALFAGGGVLHHMQTDSGQGATFDPIFSGGVQLF